MKTNRLLAVGIFLILLFCITSCGKKSDEKKNQSPVIKNQQFEVSEDIGGLAMIGKVIATDADGDVLTYGLESDVDLAIDSVTGEIKTTQKSVIDYETQKILTFEVSVTDGKGVKQKAKITIKVIDVNDGPFTNLQKDFIEEYLRLVYYKDNLSEKWKGKVKLFLDGNITDDYKKEVKECLEKFNKLMTDGTTLILVDNKEESNIHLILGNKFSIKDVWKDIFEVIKNSNEYNGYSTWKVKNNYTTEGHIWVSSSDKGLFIHEFGHILGFRGHSSDAYCGGKKRSFMCAVSTSSNFNTLDTEIIKALYHPDIKVGVEKTDMKKSIEEYVKKYSVLK
ncbi:MAG: hypothetical protein KGV44_01650 [Flavobacteriaceae bacterium]|nr:hypothetical protein [Flavobacteriaceae bacterium]